MKKKEKADNIIKKLNQVLKDKLSALKNNKYDEAAQSRSTEKSLCLEYEKLTGSLPTKDKEGNYEVFVDEDAESKRQVDLHKEAHRQQRAKGQSQTGGSVVLGLPVHLHPDNNVTAVDWNILEKDRITVVKNSRKPFRKFDGQYHKHCSKCPFKEGCITCTLP